MRGVQQLSTASSSPELGEYKGSVGSCSWVLHVPFICSAGLSLVLDPRGRLGGLGQKVGIACEEHEDTEGGTLGVLVPAHLGGPG